MPGGLFFSFECDARTPRASLREEEDGKPDHVPACLRAKLLSRDASTLITATSIHFGNAEER